MQFKYIFTWLTIVLAFAKAESQIAQDTLDIKRKAYQATRVSTAPDIDGEPFEKFWDAIPTGGDFVMLQPTNGQKERV
jgi:hypothetical protein